MSKRKPGSVFILAGELVSGSTPSLLGNELRSHTFPRKEVAHIRHHDKENRYLHRVPAHYYKHLGEIPLLLFLEGSENPISRLSKGIRPACRESWEGCSPPCVHTLQQFYKPHPRVEWCRPNWPLSLLALWQWPVELLSVPQLWETFQELGLKIFLRK